MAPRGLLSLPWRGGYPSPRPDGPTLRKLTIDVKLNAGKCQPVFQSVLVSLPRCQSRVTNRLQPTGARCNAEAPKGCDSSPTDFNAPTSSRGRATDTDSEACSSFRSGRA